MLIKIDNLVPVGSFPNIQAPKGYEKTFNWDIYLKETNTKAVPLKFFKSSTISDEKVLSSGERMIKNQELFENAKEGNMKEVVQLIDEMDCYPDVGVAGAG